MPNDPAEMVLPGMTPEQVRRLLATLGARGGPAPGVPPGPVPGLPPAPGQAAGAGGEAPWEGALRDMMERGFVPPGGVPASRAVLAPAPGEDSLPQQFPKAAGPARAAPAGAGDAGDTPAPAPAAAPAPGPVKLGPGPTEPPAGPAPPGPMTAVGGELVGNLAGLQNYVQQQMEKTAAPPQAGAIQMLRGTHLSSMPFYEMQGPQGPFLVNAASSQYQEALSKSQEGRSALAQALHTAPSMAHLGAAQLEAQAKLGLARQQGLDQFLLSRVAQGQPVDAATIKNYAALSAAARELSGQERAGGATAPGGVPGLPALGAPGLPSAEKRVEEAARKEQETAARMPDPKAVDDLVAGIVRPDFNPVNLVGALSTQGKILEHQPSLQRILAQLASRYPEGPARDEFVKTMQKRLVKYHREAAGPDAGGTYPPYDLVAEPAGPLTKYRVEGPGVPRAPYTAPNLPLLGALAGFNDLLPTVQPGTTVEQAQRARTLGRLLGAFEGYR